jgi:hypothetical protein
VTILAEEAETMAYRHYTRCVSPGGFVASSRVARIAVVAVVCGGLTAAIAVVVGEPWFALVGLEVGGLAALIAYCWIWLHNQLICIQDDVEVLGVVASLSPPSRRLLDLDWDNDYSVNLLLWDTPFGGSQLQAEQSQPFRGLATAHPTISAIGRATPGHAAQHETASGRIRSFGLPVEFGHPPIRRGRPPLPKGTSADKHLRRPAGDCVAERTKRQRVEPAGAIFIRRFPSALAGLHTRIRFVDHK